jgi:hypothetical protein
MPTNRNDTAKFSDIQRLLEATEERTRWEQRNTLVYESIQRVLQELSDEHLSMQECYDRMSDKFSKVLSAVLISDESVQRTLNLIAAYLAALIAGDRDRMESILDRLSERTNLDINVGTSMKADTIHTEDVVGHDKRGGDE